MEDLDLNLYSKLNVGGGHLRDGQTGCLAIRCVNDWIFGKMGLEQIASSKTLVTIYILLEGQCTRYVLGVLAGRSPASTPGLV